jgi:hypothetical protein
MFVSVIHRIIDFEGFFGAAASIQDKIPADLHLPQYFTAVDHATTVCLWEAASADRVKEFLEPIIGRYSANEYSEVDAEYSAGLPAAAHV